MDQNEFRHVAFKKGVTISSTSDHLTLNSLLQLKSVIAGISIIIFGGVFCFLLLVVLFTLQLLVLYCNTCFELN